MGKSLVLERRFRAACSSCSGPHDIGPFLGGHYRKSLLCKRARFGTTRETGHLLTVVVPCGRELLRATEPQ